MLCGQYPVMTLGEGLGSRVILHEGQSSLSGSYVIEECDGHNGVRIRRLVFLDTPTVSQTEMKINTGMRVVRPTS